MIELTLKEYAGQKCDVFVCIREDRSYVISFRSEEGYGFPSLSKEKCEELYTLIEKIRLSEIIGETNERSIV